MYAALNSSQFDKTTSYPENSTLCGFVFAAKWNFQVRRAYARVLFQGSVRRNILC